MTLSPTARRDRIPRDPAIGPRIEPLLTRKKAPCAVPLVVLFLASSLASLVTALSQADDSPKKKAFGIDKRIPWTTSRVVGSPDPPPPYRLESVYPALKFDQALELSIIPGSDRWVVAERYGKLYTMDTDPKTARKQLLLDLKRVVYGVVMHPQFQKNGYFYVTSITSPPTRTSPTAAGCRASRSREWIRPRPT